MATLFQRVGYVNSTISPVLYQPANSCVQQEFQISRTLRPPESWPDDWCIIHEIATIPDASSPLREH